MHSVTEMSAFRVPSLSLSPLPGRTASLPCSLVPAHSQGWKRSPVLLQISRVGSVWKVENVVSKSSIGETSKEMNLPRTAHFLGSYCDVKHSLKCLQTSESLTKQLLKKNVKKNTFFRDVLCPPSECFCFHPRVSGAASHYEWKTENLCDPPETNTFIPRWKRGSDTEILFG